MGSSEIAPEPVLLGKYRVERELGKGGMGVVVQARHIELDESVAIKLLHENLAVNQEVFMRFAREAKAAARLKSRHVVRVSDVGRLPDGMPYMVMELLDGTDLSRMLKEHGPLPVPYTIDLALQALEVLAEAHAYGIVHRDVKPSNLFVTNGDDGRPLLKLLDFGIAKAPEATDVQLTQTWSMLGSPAYMSPEQLRSSRHVDHRADIWALGVALYELLEATRPFNAESYSELVMTIGIDPPKPPVSMPAPLAGVILKCLEKDPALRYQNALELALALQPFAGDPAAAQNEIDRMQVRASVPKLRSDGTPIPTPMPTPVPAVARSAKSSALSTRRPGRNRGVLVVASAMLVIALGVVVMYVALPAKTEPAAAEPTTEPATGAAPAAPPPSAAPASAPPSAAPPSPAAPVPAAVTQETVVIDAGVPIDTTATKQASTKPPRHEVKRPKTTTTSTKSTTAPPAQPPPPQQPPPPEKKKASDPHFIDHL